METLLEVSPGIEIEEATALEQLETVRAEWDELWARCSSATPFQSPDWLIAWWRHLGEGELWTLLLRREGRLIGVAPLLISESRESNRREVLFMGTGVTDYLDVLIDPAAETGAIAALSHHLAENLDRWDVCDFQQLRPGSFLLEMNGLPGCSGEVSVQEVCPVLTLPPDPGGLRKVVPGHMLEKLAYYRRRLLRLPDARIERANEDSLPELFDAFLRLHHARWSMRGQTGVVAAPRVQDFNQEVARRMLAAGTLRFYGLRIGGRIIATLYAFGDGNRTFYYLSGFDPEFSPLSPGTLMIGHAIEEAIVEGVREFDFLRGRETYKYMWGAKGRLNCRRRLWHTLNQ